MPSVKEIQQEMERRIAARRSLLSFIQYTKPDFEVARHHEFIAPYADAVVAGDLLRLIVSEPPRHGKSEMFTRKLPAYFLGRHPTRQVISASYNADFATDFGREVRQCVASTEYHHIFPKVELRADSRAADRWNTNQGGAYYAAGIGSGITGRGMHLGIVDDPIKDQEEADSPLVRERIWRWYRTSFKTRMMPKAAIIVVQTRWHKDDLAGRLLDSEGHLWTHINLPAIATDYDALGRKPGEALWPAWYNKAALEEMQYTLSEREWRALYQGEPIVEGGNLFKGTWWKYYRELPPIEAMIQYWDTAFEAKDNRSYSVCTTWAVCENGYYLVNMVRERLEFPELIETSQVQGLKFRPNLILIEKKASGISMVQELERKSRFPILAMVVVKDKVSRARAVTSTVQGGRVFLPELAPWLDLYKAEMEEFPGGKFDDIVDSTVGALTYLQENYLLSATPSHNVTRVENDWDIYNQQRTGPEVVKDWDLYARRLH